MIVWSYGGGTQSIAIALLIAQGKLPKPDMVVMADTSREASETWGYTEQYVAPLLASLGLTIEIAPHTLATVDLYSRKGDLLLPVFTATGKLPTFCSVEWKQRVIRRYLRQRGVESCTLWLGISTDEIERLKPSDKQWITHHWPLCFDMPLNRAACAQLVRDYGWPDSPKSSCYVCPHRQNRQWRIVQKNADEWQKVVELDTAIRAGGDDLYLHWSRKPIAEVDLSDEAEDAAGYNQPSLFECNTGYCMM